eukprot:TRINITY_DN7956_c0_g1_i1.p1 TRINITY_DN7956_c0_g1~~TRINITY_DN7956_c0_g1_i1.p1  ORF type:complete len:758 (-),score=125.72 TRINITY_DN7956_c0_g1_i1:290-2563(-)
MLKCLLSPGFFLTLLMQLAHGRESVFESTAPSSTLAKLGINQTMLNSTFVAGVLDHAATAFRPLEQLSKFFALSSTLWLLHKRLQSFLLKQEAFSAISYVVLVGIFSWTMLGSFRQVIWPLTGFLFPGSMRKTQACILFQWAGPVQIVSMLFVGTFMCFTPLVLLPPLPKVADGALARLERRFGSKILSSVADTMKADYMMWFTRIYFAICFFQIHQVPAVYAYCRFHEGAMQFQEHQWAVEARKRSDWFREQFFVDIGFLRILRTNLRTPFEDIGGQGFGVISLGICFLYLVLVWAQLIVVYDRLSGRSFQEDFPYIMLVRAFPQLQRFEWISGRAAAITYRKAAFAQQFLEKAEQAAELLDTCPRFVESTHNTVRCVFAKLEAEINMSADTVAGMFELDDALASQETVEGVFENVFVTISKAALTGVEVLAAKLESSVEAAFYEKLRSLTRVQQSDSGADSANEDWVLPGDHDFRARVAKLVEECLQRCRSRGVTESDVQTRSVAAIANKLKGVVYRTRDVALSELHQLETILMKTIGGALAELRDLAYASSRLRGAIDAKYEFLSQLVLGVRGDLKVMNLEAQQLVHGVKRLPVMGSKSWLIIYTCVGSLLISLATVTGIMVFGVVYNCSGERTTIEKAICVFGLSVFASATFFMTHFWFLAVTGRLEEMDMSATVKGEFKVRDAQPSVPGNDPAHSQRRHRCFRAMQNIVCFQRFCLFLGAFAMTLAGAVVLAANGMDRNVCGPNAGFVRSSR